MQKYSILLFCIISISTSQSQPANTDNLLPDTLIERHIAAIGGREALSRIKNRTMIAKIESSCTLDSITPFLSQKEFFVQMYGQFNQVLGYPNKSYEQIQMYSQEHVGDLRRYSPPQYICNDGSSVVASNPSYQLFGQQFEKNNIQMVKDKLLRGADEKLHKSVDSMLNTSHPPTITYQGTDLYKYIEDHTFNEALRTKELGYGIVIDSRIVFDGRHVFKVFVKKLYSTEVWLFDCASYLILGKFLYKQTDDNHPKSIIRFQDYRSVDGVLLPFRIIESDNRSFGITYVVQSYVHNQDIPEAMYMYPNSFD